MKKYSSLNLVKMQNIVFKSIQGFNKLFSFIFSRHRGKNFVYVAIGDSSVEGLGASHPDRSYTGIIYQQLKLTLKNTQYHNLGKAFAKVNDVIENQLDKTIALKPDLITISVGTNDIIKKTSFKEFEKELFHLLSNLKTNTTADIVINTIPDLTNAPVVPRHMRLAGKVILSRVNNIIRKQAKACDVRLVDLYETSRIFTRSYPEVLSEDGFHPSDFGYAIWANTIIGEIKHLLWHDKKDLSALK